MLSAKQLLLRPSASVPPQLAALRTRWTSPLLCAGPSNVRMLTVRAAATPEGSGPEPQAKHFKDIPRPKGYPLIGTALDYRNDKYTMSRVIKRRLDKFGHIYRERIFPGFPEQVVIFDPKDVESVFRSDSEWPQRPEGGDIFKRLLKEADLNPGLFLL